MQVKQSYVDKILSGDCKEIISRIPNGSIQLTITSPPYRNAIDYNAHISKNGSYYRGKSTISTKDYLEEMIDIFNNKIYNATKDGGYCCIVIAN